MQKQGIESQLQSETINNHFFTNPHSNNPENINPQLYHKRLTKSCLGAIWELSGSYSGGRAKRGHFPAVSPNTARHQQVTKQPNRTNNDLTRSAKITNVETTLSAHGIT